MIQEYVLPEPLHHYKEVTVVMDVNYPPNWQVYLSHDTNARRDFVAFRSQDRDESEGHADTLRTRITAVRRLMGVKAKRP